jgi:hypothetical protein
VVGEFSFIEIQKFGEKASVKFGIRLELKFAEINGRIRIVESGEEHPISTKSGLFDLNGSKLIVLGDRGRLTQHLKKDARKSFEAAVPDRVCFHKNEFIVHFSWRSDRPRGAALLRINISQHCKTESVRIDRKAN